ncbi:MAG: hypothetical protein Kow0013_04710 [Pararhodobacter sp.]
MPITPMQIAALLAAAVAASAAHAEPPEPGRLIAVLSGDWTSDEEPDAVVLVQAPDGMADLTIYEGGFRGLEPVLSLPGRIDAGPLAGAAPGLEARGPRRFAILTEQTGVGREPWYQSLTVTYREGDYWVTGYAYDFYDRLDPGNHGSCAVDLETGAFRVVRGQGEDRPDRVIEGRGAPQMVRLADLGPGYWPDACTALDED